MVIVSSLSTVSVRLPWMVIVSLLSTVSVRSCLTRVVSSWSMVLRAVVADPVRLVVLDADGLVLLGVDVDQLARPSCPRNEISLKFAGLPPRLLTALDAALRLVRRQPVGRHRLGVVDAADDDRLVGVAFEEVDDDFLADARDVDDAPLLAGPDASPRGSSTSCRRRSCPGGPSGTAPSPGRICR